MRRAQPQREFDFALVIDGVPELTSAVEDALFEAGCDDGTFSIQYGRLYGEFSRRADSLQHAILSAIKDIRRAKIGAVVLRVDESDLVTPAEIARRINRSRQLVFQYIKGQRGPGDFPPPQCHLDEAHPLWAWCAVSAWLAANQIIRPEAAGNAEVVAMINNCLELARQRRQDPGRLKDIEQVCQLS